MLKWLLTLVLALLLIAAFTPLFTRLGLGKLPGDLRIRRNGKDYLLPIASTLVLSAVLAVITWILR